MISYLLPTGGSAQTRAVRLQSSGFQEGSKHSLSKVPSIPRLKDRDGVCGEAKDKDFSRRLELSRWLSSTSGSENGEMASSRGSPSISQLPEQERPTQSWTMRHGQGLTRGFMPGTHPVLKTGSFSRVFSPLLPSLPPFLLVETLGETICSKLLAFYEQDKKPRKSAFFPRSHNLSLRM